MDSQEQNRKNEARGEVARKINKVVRKAWLDDGFKKSLLANPTATLKQEGIDIPAGGEVRVSEDTHNVRNLVLPLKPSATELSEEQLTQVAGDGRVCQCGPCAATFYQCKSACAYNLLLKNVGALYQTMYLVATAMDLAPCALGAGHSDLFAKAAGLDYYAETSVGEFLLGSKRKECLPAGSREDLYCC